MWGVLRQNRKVTVALVAVLAVALGFAVGVLSTRDNLPQDDSAEAGFARDMSLHHSQAVAMSMYVYRNGQDEDVRTLAYDISLTQQGQIGIMNAWFTDWKVSPTSTEEPMQWMEMPMDMGDDVSVGRLMPGMATQPELDEFYTMTGIEADLRFCELMLTHHVGGVHMAEGVLDLTERPEVVALAESMVRGQRAEIDLLNGMIDRLEAQAADYRASN